jgi:hypothetical protein
MFNAEGRGSPSDATGLAVLNTAPPGRAGRWRGGETRTQPPGVERGRTLASSVAAPAGLTTTTAITLVLEPEHADEFVAIEPESGDYFLGKTLSQATQAARKNYPHRLTHVIHVEKVRTPD